MDPSPGATDEQRHVCLHRFRVTPLRCKLVVLPGECDGLTVQEAAEHDDRLFESCHPDARRVEGEACPFVFQLRMTGTNAEFEAPVAHQVGCRCRPRQQRWVMEVVVENHYAKSQTLAHLRCRRQWQQRREAAAQMVRSHDHVEPGVVGPSDQLTPLTPRMGLATLEAEPERPTSTCDRVHSRMMPLNAGSRGGRPGRRAEQYRREVSCCRCGLVRHFFVARSNLRDDRYAALVAARIEVGSDELSGWASWERIAGAIKRQTGR